MIKTACFKNFTTIPNGELQFAAGLNVIVAENGCGKTHLLKALYCILKVNGGKDLSKSALERLYADKLVRVFRSESLGRLVKRKQGRERCELTLVMDKSERNCSISFATQASTSVQVDIGPQKQLEKPPVFLPTRELLTLCPWFGPLYDNYDVPFEETWRDTVSLLGNPTLRGPRAAKVTSFLAPLEDAMGGKVIVDDKTGKFYLQITGEGKMEMPLVAEGLRKVAMLARLISAGVLLQQGYLFWDEPETNLNPKLIKVIANCIMHLCTQGIQVFIASHSLFLLRELDMLSEQQTGFKKVKQRWFSLKVLNNQIELEQGDRVDELQTLVLLDEALQQSDRFMAQVD
jgi:energy-coupling factor transporter ATP-binding protein EcfA2